MPRLFKGHNFFLLLLLVISLVQALLFCLLPHAHSVAAPMQIISPLLFLAVGAPLIWTTIVMPLRRFTMAEMGRTKITLENMVDGVINFDTMGCIQSINPAAERLFGHKAAEIIGRDFSSLIPHDPRTLGACSEISARHKDGSLFPAEISISTLTVGKRTSFLAIVRDVSERKRAELALGESETRYHTLFRNMLNGFAYCQALLNEEGVLEDLVFLDVNEAFSKLTGLEGVIGKKASEVYRCQPGEMPEHFQIYGRVAVTMQPEVFEIFHEILGQWFVISVFSTEPGHFVLILENITARKTAEQEIVKAKTDWERTFDAIVDPVMILDTKHRIVKANKSMAAALNQRECDLVGGRCCQWMHQSSNPLHACPHSQLLMDRKPHSGEIFDSRSGRYFDVTVSPLFSQDGKLEGSIHFSRDITEQKNLEKQLLHAQKMEAVGTLAGGVAHDFNNMLTAIMGYGSLLQMKLASLDPAMEAQASAMLDAAGRAADLTRSLLTFSRKEQVELKPSKLNEVVSHAQKMLRRLIREDIEIRLELAAEALHVLADCGQLEQVLMNLAVNSQDAIHGTGMLSVKTGMVELDGSFRERNGYGAAGRYAVLSYCDTGAGMDEQTRQRIFEPFFTTKEAGKGTGLGLSIVYGIVKQHNGYIQCSSQPGAGTSFEILLPLTEKSLARQSVVSETSVPRGTETILVAEDDEQARGFLKDALEGFGYTVIAAGDGEEAVSRFREHHEVISLAVVDTIMPKLNGREAYGEMERIKPAIKGVFISGHPARLVMKHVPGSGVAFVAKPIRTTDFLQTVRRLLDSGPTEAEAWAGYAGEPAEERGA